MIDAYVALGANLGDRLGALAAAVELIAREPGLQLRAVSSVWDTAPVGPPQPRYLNAVARVGTLLNPRATLRALHLIEERLGRVRREKWGPREIDLDLLLFGWQRVDGPVEVPHPRMHERAFVLLPLCELNPMAPHPVLGKTAAELLAALPPAGRDAVRKVGPLRRRDLPEAEEAPLEDAKKP